MGNEYRMIYTAIWTDPDFRKLSGAAQRLYMLMLTHPSLSACGVLDWKEAKLAKFAGDTTVQVLREAAYELGRGGFIAVDPETEEALVRSFVRHDGKLKSPNPARAVVKAYGSIGSLTLMQIVSIEVRRAASEHPDWKGLPYVGEITKQFQELDSYPSEMVPNWFVAPSSKGSDSVRSGFEKGSDSVRSEFEKGSDSDTPKMGEPFEMSSHIRITDNREPEVLRTSIGDASANAEAPTHTNHASARRSPKTPISNAWRPTDKHHEQARTLGLDLNTEAEKFRRDALAHDRRYVRWDQAFGNWLARSAEYAAQRTRTAPQRSSTDDRVRGWLNLAADMPATDSRKEIGQ